MEVKRSNRIQTVIGLRPLHFGPAVSSFLEENPLIFIDEEKLKGLILADKNGPLSLKEVRSALKTYFIPGLDSLILLSSQGFRPDAEAFVSSNAMEKGMIELIHGTAETFFSGLPAWHRARQDLKTK